VAMDSILLRIGCPENPRRSRGKNDLAENFAGFESRESIGRSLQPEDAVDTGSDAGGDHQFGQRGQFLASTHCRTLDTQLQEEDSIEVCGRVGT